MEVGGVDAQREPSRQQIGQLDLPTDLPVSAVRNARMCGRMLAERAEVPSVADPGFEPSSSFDDPAEERIETVGTVAQHREALHRVEYALRRIGFVGAKLLCLGGTVFR